MSVYTQIKFASLRRFLGAYSLGEPQQLQGISDGIENSNFYVTTDQGKYILTLFETLSAQELPFFLRLMAFYSEHNIPCPHPIVDNQGNYLGTLENRPAALIERIVGKSVTKTTPRHCEQIGASLANMHRASLRFTLRRQNPYDSAWQEQAASALVAHLSANDTQLLQSERHDLAKQSIYDLPAGIIHGDLFRDNALFDKQILTGLLDFYDASNGVFIFDLAITVNDWCTTENGKIIEANCRALLHAYNRRRRLLENEHKVWPAMLRQAALRFWLSRLLGKHFPRPGHLVLPKDPDAFKQILLSHIDENSKLLDLWV